MDPLTFILGVASTVLSNVMTELITGKSEVARKSEIEKQVSVILLREYRQENQDLRIMLHKVMGEIETLSNRDPDLFVRNDRIELKRPFRRQPVSPGEERAVKDEIASRLHRLEQIILQRRKELRLPTRAEEGADKNLPPEENVSESIIPQVNVSESHIPEGWVFVGETQQADSKWLRAIRETEDRIQKRRSKEARDEQPGNE